ncbi:SdpC family antimicrobial peptide [Spirosoma lacussanchae]|uniref:hypothetical protein n=1 Tax=Spirosoma lacussanchae TaxID=1884249 RepID=UPI001109FBBF|nr:hypothetical protein [Spirosoma lacussanchae]
MGSVLFLTTNCQNQSKVIPSSLTGEEIFRGVFFLEGNFVDKIGTLKNQKELFTEVKEKYLTNFGAQEAAKVKVFQEGIMVHIKDSDSRFFLDFQKAMTSGDPYTVKQGMIEAQQKVNTYWKTVNMSAEELEHSKQMAKEILQSDEAKAFINKKNATIDEKKVFVASVTEKVAKESKRQSSYNGRIASPNGADCIVLGFVFLIAAVFLIVLAVVLAFGVVLVGAGAIAIVGALYEEWAVEFSGVRTFDVYFSPEGKDMLSHDVFINELAVNLSL